MTDFVPEPRDRLEAPICKAIESQDFKQALKLVEKRLSKNSDPYLLALRCFILCNSQVVVERGRALAIIMELGKLLEQRYSAAELDLYDEGLKILFPEAHNAEGRIICKMRADAVKAAPQDDKLALACFRACLKRDNLEYAQQVANNLEKNFPSNRAYIFWSITMTALYANSPHCPTQLVQLYSKLAYTKIKNLAKSTINSTDQSNPSNRSLQTPQELLLFYRLLAAYGEDAEALKFCRDEGLGPTSKIAKDEWIFRRKQIELMEAQNEWQELFDTTLELLSMARANNKAGTIIDTRGGDWLVWKAFLRAVFKLETENVIAGALAEFQDHLDQESGLDKTYRRNALLAYLHFKLSVPSPESPAEGPFRFLHGYPPAGELSSRVFGLCRHLYQFGHNASTFNDIKFLVEKLSIQEQKSFIKACPHFPKHLIGTEVYVGGEYRGNANHIRDRYHGAKKFPLPKPGPECTWYDITSGITASKLSYLVKSSLAEMNRADSLEKYGCPKITCSWCGETCGIFCKVCLQSLAIEFLRSYSLTMADDEGIGESLKSTDRHPADEWVILAAMCMMKLAGCRPWIPNESHDLFSKVDTQQILRACLVLEFAYTRSRANPQISLLLVRLYSHLGAGSLALRAYNRLGIKQIQGDTLSYSLFDRISSLHPHTVDEGDPSELLDPSNQLKKLQRLYRGFRNHVITNSWRSFEHGSYDSIFQLMEVSSRLSTSMAAAMSATELRRIDRLIQGKSVLSKSSHGYDVLSPEPASNSYSDNADYSSFPNYEHTEGYPFEKYTRIAPGPSQIRTQAFLILEELWMVALNVSESKAKQAAAHARINHFSDTALLVKTLVEQDLPGFGNLTIPEALLMRIGITLIRLVTIACDEDEPGKESVSIQAEKFCRLVGVYMNDFTAPLAEAVKGEQPDDEWMPTFVTTLHPFYTAHEAGTLVLAVGDYLSNAAIWVNPRVQQPMLRMTKFARRLRNHVSQKARKVRLWINGPRLDWVLEKITSENHGEDKLPLGSDTDIDEEVFERVNGYRRDLLPDPPQIMGDLLTECVSPDFLESWAGELVESWRESVMGLACLKSDELAP